MKQLKIKMIQIMIIKLKELLLKIRVILKVIKKKRQRMN